MIEARLRRAACRVRPSGCAGRIPAVSFAEIPTLEAVLAAVAASRNLPALLAIIRTSARPLLASDGITFVLRDSGFCYYADEDAISPLWKGQRFPMHTCISGWVMERGTPAVIEDVFADARVPTDLYRRTFVRSLAMVPIGTPPHTLAAIGAYWARRHRGTPRELRTLEALAGQAARVLEETCPRCLRRGFVRVENTIARGVASRSYYCGVCEHTWLTR
jgi:GAF domain-containing protein